MTRLRPAPAIATSRVATRLWHVADRWCVLARQPLCLGPLRWVYMIPEADLSLYRQARFVGALHTVQGRDVDGVLCLYARRGDNRKWWIQHFGD